MSNLTTFDYFPHLPKEIRDMIWQHSLTPQLISFRCKIYNFAPRHAPAFIFFLGGDEPYTHFTMEDIPRPCSPYFTAHLEPVNINAPGALSTCRESRNLAESKGYKAWRMVHHDGKIRDVMWNPSKDTVLLVETDSRHSFDLFLEQFPTQVREVQRFAISLPKTTRLWRPLTNFSALVKLCIFVDRDLWEEWSKDQWKQQDSRFPDNVRRRLREGRMRYLENYQEWHGPHPIEVPRVTVAWNYDMILRGEGRNCRSCI